MTTELFIALKLVFKERAGENLKVWTLIGLVCVMIDGSVQWKPHLSDRHCHLQDNQPWRSAEGGTLGKKLLTIKMEVFFLVTQVLLTDLIWDLNCEAHPQSRRLDYFPWGCPDRGCHDLSLLNSDAAPWRKSIFWGGFVQAYGQWQRDNCKICWRDESHSRDQEGMVRTPASIGAVNSCLLPNYY